MSRAADIALRTSRGVAWSHRTSARAVPRGALSVADQVVASATTFLTGALVARACTKSEFGLYTMGFSLLALLLTVQTSLIATPFMVKLPRLSPAEARRLAGNSLIHQILFGVLAAIVVVAFGGVVNVNDTALGKMLLALGAALSFLLLRDYIRQYGFARLEYARVLAFDVQLAVLQCAGLAALWAAGVLSAATAFLVLGAASALTALHWSFVTRTQRTLSRKALLADLANNWSSGKWLLASGLVWAVGMNLYAWIVAAFHGTASAGAWAAALGVMTLINPLMLGIQNYIGPHIMHARAEGGVIVLRRVVRGAACAFCAVLVAFACAMVFIGGDLVTLVYGAQYAGNGTLVVLLSLNAAVSTVGFATSRGLFALDCARADFYVNFCALACFVVLGVALARAFGPTGAAVGQLSANLIATAARTLVFERVARGLALGHS